MKERPVNVLPLQGQILIPPLVDQANLTQKAQAIMRRFTGAISDACD